MACCRERCHEAVDAKATQALRAQIRKDRIAKSVPTKEWMKGERQILAKDAATQVRQMLAASYHPGRRFEQQFRSFWDQPESWSLSESEIVPAYGSRHSIDIPKCRTRRRPAGAGAHRHLRRPKGADARRERERSPGRRDLGYARKPDRQKR